MPNDNTITIWDAYKGKCEKTLGENLPTFAVTYSPDGKYLISAEGGINVWDTITWQSKRIKECGIVTKVIFSADGQFLASVCSGEVEVLDVKTWQSLEIFHNACNATFVKNELMIIKPSGMIDSWFFNRKTRTFQLRWCTDTKSILCEGALLMEVDGLSEMNKKLLKQYGATGDPSKKKGTSRLLNYSRHQESTPSKFKNLGSKQHWIPIEKKNLWSQPSSKVKNKPKLNQAGCVFASSDDWFTQIKRSLTNSNSQYVFCFRESSYPGFITITHRANNKLNNTRLGCYQEGNQYIWKVVNHNPDKWSKEIGFIALGAKNFQEEESNSYYQTLKDFVIRSYHYDFNCFVRPSTTQGETEKNQPSPF